MNTIQNKRILISGGGGSIGSELVRQLAPNNKVFILDFNETAAFDLAEELQQDGHWVHARIGDIRNKETVDDLFSDFKPEIVFHAAAYKHVSPMETYPEEAIQTNIVGTLNLIKASKRWKVKKFIFISTDKVISSNSIMGATKRVAEIMTKNQGDGFIAVRFGNVLGSRGSVLPLWQNQIDRGKPITITDKRMERYMMTIPQACALVIGAATIGKGGEIMILDMGVPIKILDLAKAIVEASGKDIEIKEIGIRKGETLTEKLMFEEEEKIAVKEGNYWIIK